MVKKTSTSQWDNPTVEELMAHSYDHEAPVSKTYTQLAAEHPELGGLRVLASREVHTIHRLPQSKKSTLVSS